MTPEEILQLDDQLLAAINSHEFDRFAALLADDFSWHDWNYPEPFRDRSEMQTYLEAWWTAFPDFEDTRIERIVGDDAVAVEVVWTGTHAGHMALVPGYDLPPTNKKITAAKGTETIRMRDGKIVSWRTRPDVLGALVQFDLLG